MAELPRGLYSHTTETDPHDEAVPEREALTDRWGLVPWGLKPENEVKQLKLSTFNARSETVANSFTFAGAWHRALAYTIRVR
ncbi:MAG: hypothetical protein ABI040_10530 [Rhodoferax sp.]